MGKPDRSFEGLCRLFQLRPIRSDVVWGAAKEVADLLVGQKHLGLDQQDYLDTLQILIRAYHVREVTINCNPNSHPRSSPVDAPDFVAERFAKALNELGIKTEKISEEGESVLRYRITK